MAKIETYVCNKKLPAIKSVGNSLDAISVSDRLVQAKILPKGTDVQKGRIEAKIMPNDTMADMIHFFESLEPLTEEGNLEWARKVTYYDDPLVDSQKDFFVTIEVNHPDVPCYWKRTWVYGIRMDVSDKNSIYIAQPLSVVGEIPEETSDVYQGLAGDTTEITNSQTLFVPGELLQLEWLLKIDDQFFSHIVSGKYFATPAFTGGEVVEITGSGETKRIVVDTQNNNVTCLPTDLAEYQVGEWVYLLKQDTSPATTCGRTSEYDDDDATANENDPFGDNPRTIPLIVNDIGGGGEYETIPYDMFSTINFRQFFEVSQHIGVLLSVDYDDNTATVLIDEDGENGISGTFSNVKIFYNCSDNSTANGSSAFAAGDSVVVLNDFGVCAPDSDNLTIVGLEDTIRYCSGEGVILISTLSGGEAIAYDLIDEEIIVEKDTKENVLQQLENLGITTSPKQIGVSSDSTSEESLGRYYDIDYADERTDFSSRIPTIWATSDWGLRSNQLTPYSILSPAETLEIPPGDHSWAGQYDYVNKLAAKIDYIQNPYNAENINSHFKYDVVSDLTFRSTPATGYPTAQYMTHSVFDNAFPLDSELPETEQDAGNFLHDRWNFYGTSLYYLAPDMGDIESGAVVREPSEFTDFQASKYGVAANAAGAAIVEDTVYHIDFPDAGVTDTTYRDIRMFLRDIRPVLNSLEEKAMELINFERTNRNLDPYVWNHVIARATERHSQDMADNGFLSHTGSDGSSSRDRVEDAGYLIHPTVGMVLEDNAPDAESDTLNNWMAENAGKIDQNATKEDILANPPNNMYEDIFEEVLAQDEYSEQGVAELMVACWMASTEGHRDTILDDNCGEYVPDEKGDGYGANEMAITAIIGEDGNYYWTFVVGRRFWHWPGYGCVDTQPIIDYVNANFEFTDADAFEESEGWWFVSGEKAREDVTEPHWLLKPYNHESDFGFGDAPEMPKKKELEYYLL